jgi:hypothetical protein
MKHAPRSPRSLSGLVISVVAVSISVVAAAGCDADPDGGGDGPVTLPITERAGTRTQACRITRPRADHSPRQWQRTQAIAVTRGGVAYLARVEGLGTDPLSPIIPGRARLIVSRFSADGAFGEPVTISDSDWPSLFGVAIARLGDGFAVVWVEEAELRFAAFDGQARPTVTPRTIQAPGFGDHSRPQVVEGPDGGLGVVYATEGGSAPARVMFFTMDGTGQLRAAPRRLGDSPSASAAPAPAIVADGQGYAVAWRGAGAGGGQIMFARADAAGAEVVAPRAVSAPAGAGVMVGSTSGFDPPTTALLAVGGGYLAAWTEVRWVEYPGKGAWSIVRVVRLDAAGVAQGPPAPLRAPEAEVDEVEPTLLPFGDAVAVMWGRGSHIYACAGCVPDHRIDLVLVDPATLQPLSDPVTISPGETQRPGGLLRRQVAVLGSTLLATFNLTFHVHATPGSATLTCEPR